MNIITKLNDNNKSYKDLTPSFIDYGGYEEDVDSLTKEMEASNEAFDKQKTQYCFQFSNYPTNDKYFVVGKIISRFEESKSPFYLTPDVIAKARSSVDISSHKFFRCSVKWHKYPINEEDELFDELKKLGICRRKTIWRKTIPVDSLLFNTLSSLF